MSTSAASAGITVSTGTSAGTAGTAGAVISGSTAGTVSAGAVLASDAAACASRGHEVQQLAARTAACVDHVDAVLARLVSVEMQSWQSPAGRAYRTSLSLQAASLRRSRTALQEAVAVVLRHAQNVMLSPGRPG
ncbi:hypothetical protein PJ267_14910 [Arthrobacter sp. OVS8]|nr:hypothetical protein PJ267_14910 [Arthrobacter sp. OVS8]